MSDQSTKPINVTVSGDADIQLFIVSPDLSLLHRGHLPWSGTLPAGVYGFKYRRGTTVKEETIFLDPSKPTYAMSAPALETPSAAPLESSSRSHEYHMEAALKCSTKTHKSVGSGGQLFLFVRDWQPHGRAPRTEDPAAGLRILGGSGRVIAEVGEACESGGTGEEDRWSALNLELTPGGYVLHLTTRNDEKFEQSVVVMSGWQTQVFLLLTDHAANPPADWRADLARATVFMAPVGKGFRPGDQELRLTDTALAWLSARQHTTAGNALEQALDLKHQNPMLALYAAHALIAGRQDSLAEWRESGGERADSKGFRESSFRRVVDNLSGLVPDHPDAVALRLWLGEASSGPLPHPPMLANSWPIIVGASATTPSLLPTGSLSARIGGSLYGSGPWLMWMPDHCPDEETGEVDVWALVDQAVRRARSGSRKPDWVKHLDVVERALLQYAAPEKPSRRKNVSPEAASSPVPRKPRAIADLIRSTGLPLSILQGAAMSLSRRSAASQKKRASARDD